MRNFLFYVSLVFIWGTSWIAIKFQTGEVPVENSGFYRHFSAAILMFVFLIISKRLRRLRPIDHLFCMMQGACLFGFNFYFFYIVTDLNIETGLLSVVFSMATIFNMVNNRFWYKVIPSRNTIIGAIIGVTGIALLFYPDLMSAISNDSDTRFYGVSLAVIGTFLFSTGNMISVRHNKHQLPLLTTTAWAMLYGSMIMFTLSLIFVGSFNFDTSSTYVLSLAFLVVFASVIAFAAYLSLINSIGANKTAYATVLFPIVALSISAVIEDYVFTPLAIVGLLLAIIGNIIVFYKPKTVIK